MPVQPLRDEVANVGSRQPLHVSLSSPMRGEEGGEGEGEGASGVLRRTGAETVATLFQRVTETYVLPATVPLTMYGAMIEPHLKLRFLILL